MNLRMSTILSNPLRFKYYYITVFALLFFTFSSYANNTGSDQHVIVENTAQFENIDDSKQELLALLQTNNASATTAVSEGSKAAEKKKEKEGLNWGVWEFLQIVGALGLFIYGMKVMSDGLQKAAGKKLRQVLRTMTKTRLGGILTGLFTTTLIQSSSATTVMVVSFVNAGLLTLLGAFGVIMGANIGTTITAWLVAILGFKVSITPIAIVLIGLAFPFLFTSNNRRRNIAEFILGFGILFIGLSYLKDSVPDIKGNPDILAFVENLRSLPYIVGLLLFICIGTILTVIVQSSSAAMAITLTLLAQGWVPFEFACAMVLGENIGTTITANIAASIANITAKRAARFHTVFNLIGVVWMIILFPVFTKMISGSIDGVYNFFTGLFDQGAYGKKSVLKDKDLMALALFHTTFNILNVLLLMWFVPYFEKLVYRMVKSSGDDDEETELKYIGGGLLDTAELSLENARKETIDFGKVVYKMTGNLTSLLFAEPKRPGKLIGKIKEREEITDNKEIMIANFLARISEMDISADGSHKIQSIMSICNDMERMGDILLSTAFTYEAALENDVPISASTMNTIKSIFDKVQERTKKMLEDLEIEIGTHDVWEAQKAEEEINKLRDSLQKKVFKGIEKGELNSPTGIALLDMIGSAERLGDHIINVNEALAGLK